VEEMSQSDPASSLTTGILKTVVFNRDGRAANAVTRNEQKGVNTRVFPEESNALV